MYSGERELLREEDVRSPRPAPDTVPEAELTEDGRDSGGLHPRDLLGLQRVAGNQAVARMLSQAHEQQIQRVPIGGVPVTSSGGYPSWPWDGGTWHLNMRFAPDSYHITKDGAGDHYYFTVERGYERGQQVVRIEDLTGTGHQKKGMGKQEHKETRRRYSELPAAMRQWFEPNFDAIMAVS